MKRFVILLAAIFFALNITACVATAPVKKTYVKAKEKPPEVPAEPEYVAVPVPVPMPGQAKRLPDPKEYEDLKREAISRARAAKPAETIDTANLMARQMPSEEGYFNAIMLYDYVPGALFQIYTAPGKLTDIQLQPGERIEDYSAGDTHRWFVFDTASGHPTGLEQAHIYVKPLRPGLNTNLFIATTKRIYHLEVTSYQESYMAAVAWNYPLDHYRKASQNREENLARKKDVIETQLDFAKLNFEYEIEGDEPVWRPLRVFDDGHKTFIQLPEEAAYDEAPVLFILSMKKKAQLVNYRKKGAYYIVDRLFKEAQLVVGEKDPVTVTIKKIAS